MNLSRIPWTHLFSVLGFSILASSAQAKLEPQHHRIEIEIDHRKQKLKGTTTIILSGKSAPETLVFSLLDGTIARVSLNGKETSDYLYGYPDSYPQETISVLKRVDQKIFAIPVPEDVSRQDQVTLTVEYEDDHFYGAYENPDGGRPEGQNPFSLGQITEHDAFSSHIQYYPFASNFGRSADIIIRTNLAGASVVTSGKLVSDRVESDGWRRVHYRTSHGPGLIPYPFSIGRQQKLEKLAPDGKTWLRIYHLPEDLEFAREKMNVIGDIFAMYLELFGRYPFPSLSIVETELKEGNIGLAGQSLIMLSKEKWFASPLSLDDKTFRNNALYVLADEINHQWNAYKIAAPNFLAESMSKYVDALYSERIGGTAVYLLNMKWTADSVVHLVRARPDLDKAVTDPSAHPIIYFNKGALALHMLRARIGKEAFLRGLRLYFTRYEGKTAGLAELRQAMEEASELPLGPFFEEWYERPGIPEFELEPSAGSAVRDPGPRR